MADRWIRIFVKYKEWFVFTLALDIMFCLFLWLSGAPGFFAVFPSVLLACLILYGFLGTWLDKRDQKKQQAFLQFMEDPGAFREKTAFPFMNAQEKEAMGLMGDLFEKMERRIREQETAIQEYEEYIELWAHEIKTPLALMTFVLDNRRDEMSSVVFERLEYARTDIEENIERMLYYARMRTGCTDYLFEELSLSQICRDVLDGYENLLREQKICIINEVEDLCVLSDRKGLSFLIRQAVSNAVKYAKQGAEPSFIRLYTKSHGESGDIILAVRDNGIGVKPYDLPFLFEKGFTGDTEEKRKNSTGMGLYLTKQTADSLAVRIEVPEQNEEGFEIMFRFLSV
ncbi:sensor histidine kinase [Anaerostipes sp.]|uniref:sensor histidine kinase n=1 Tax=Anaerostipes sp. TaxID=1872530 RepID=UPI0025C6317F|nr:sensor histidine kinase [Anaerostipes sp.]MBS7007697.1 sensor histidine kinase [Anaerostipes sp.]